MKIYLMNNMIIYFILMLSILISIAFLTLFERKLLGYIHLRKGPNKIYLKGIFQPFSDVMKLFLKESMKLKNLNYVIYLISPIFGLVLLMMNWVIFPYMMNEYSMNLAMMYMFTIISMSVYMIMMSGWSSNSLYALLGSIRSIAQTISYEVILMLLIILELMMLESFNINNFIIFQEKCWLIFMNLLLSILMYISILAELNRTPFDLSEGESELVSGFNVEYMSGKFALIFMIEYGMIMFFMMLYKIMFLNGNLFNLLDLVIYMVFLIMLIFIRGSMPRIRYDKLMYLIWKSFLPYCLNYYLMIYFLKFFMEMI
uniref:NADH-ubiquinone oxidoreductase chain 1 n=1 Tax=Pristaulacus sp. ZJUH_2016030 TaxID=2491655 RepID=A0A3Q8UAB9_9HYME|nr:NADH dehydrogenase subunit 1 [Pristaulacus sp. ZJUH_2016030]